MPSSSRYGALPSNGSGCMTAGANGKKISSMRRSDHDRLVNRLPFSEPLDREWSSIERAVRAELDELGDGQAGGRRLHRSVTREARGEEKVVRARMLPQDRIVIDGIGVIEAAPHREEPAALHPRHTLLQVVVDLLLIILRVGRDIEAGLRIGVGPADEEIGTFRPEVDPVIDN